MNYVFFGTPDFAAQCLTALLEHGFIPSAVVSNPDRPTGRKKILTAPAVKTAVVRWNETHGTDIPIFQPEKLDAAFMEKLTSLRADFFLVFAYNKIFRKQILDIPRLGTVGIHPSMLPKYRGPSPFQTALLDGQTETGVTLYLLDEGVDSGPILAQSEPVAISPTDTFQSLATKLADAGANLAIKTLPAFVNGAIKPEPQNEAQATFTKKFKTEDGFVEADDLAAAENGNHEKAAIIIHKIQAFNPEPSCWTMQNGKRVKLLEAEIIQGTLKLIKTQQEGEKPKTP
jgi:methionyl-tRNA formyltransferase